MKTPVELDTTCQPNPRIPMIGKTFGQLTVLSFAGKDKDKALYWRCLCACGQETVVRGSHLRYGETKSCGCDQNTHQYKHGLHHLHLSEYSSWQSMIQRCTNPKAKMFKNYGGRGITVCPQWRDSFETFLSDMGFKPSKNHSIERKDNDGNYCPENCRWATDPEQARNKRSNVWITFRDETRTLQDWSNITGINRYTLHGRLFKWHWTIEEALTTPPIKA